MPTAKDYFSELKEKSEMKRQIIDSLIYDYSNLEELKKFPLLNKATISKLEKSINEKQEILGLNRKTKIIKCICDSKKESEKYIMKEERRGLNCLY